MACRGRAVSRILCGELLGLDAMAAFGGLLVQGLTAVLLGSSLPDLLPVSRYAVRFAGPRM